MASTMAGKICSPLSNSSMALPPTIGADAGVRPDAAVIHLFRVRGIPVQIDYGWLLIFAVISWSLASGYFPRVIPALSPAAYWLQGLVAALLLFATVFLHELSHALVA